MSEKKFKKSAKERFAAENASSSKLTRGMVVLLVVMLCAAAAGIGGVEQHLRQRDTARQQR